MMKFVSVTAVALLASACSTVDSSKIVAPSTPTTAGTGRGIAYFLPRQLAKVTAKRTEIALDKSIEALGKAELALSVAKAQSAAAKAAVKETEDTLVARGDIVAVRDLLIARLADQKKALTEAEADVPKKEAARKAAADALTTAIKADNANKAAGKDDPKAKLFNVTVDIALLAPSADPGQGYRLNPRHSAFRDDEHKLAISAGGLLTSVDVVAADRTADALVELATFAGAVAGARTDSCAATEITEIVDFTDKKAVERANVSLACLGARIDVIGDLPEFAEITPKSGSVFEGIVYRSPLDVLVQVRKCPTTSATCTKDQMVPAVTLALSLPQAGPISYIPQNAGLFTKTTYGTTFKDGILITYNANRPSEVLHVAGTPMRLVNGFFEGASKIVSLRTGQSNSEVSALNARKSLTEAELSLMQAEAKRDAANRCVGDKVAKGEPYESCFALP